MAVTRINNNQITDASAGNVYVGIDASTKLQPYSITATKIANNLVYGSDLTVSGNLTVNGTSTAIDTTITTIEDPVIVLASTQTGAPSVDIGYIGERGSANNIAFVWDESSQEFVTVFTNTSETNTTVNIIGYADFHTQNANIAGNLNIGGNIDITGNITNLSVTGNITGGNLLTPGIVSAAGDITSTANVNGGNINTAGRVSATGNIVGGNVFTGGIVNATGTITGGNLATGGNITANGTASVTGNVTGGNVLTGGQVSATGNIATSGFFLGDGSQISNVAAASVYANALVGNTLSANVIYSSLQTVGNLTSLSVVGTAQVGNLQTTGQVSATGNVAGGNVNTAGQVSATGNVTGGNVFTAGLISATGSLTAGSLETSGTANVTNTITGGNISTGGFVTATGTITGGNLATGGTVSATGNAISGNVNTAGTVSATGNVVGGNVTTAGQVSATGNVTGGNVVTTGTVSSTGTITGGNLATSGTVSATGTATLGNVNTSGLISATGTITSATTITGGNLATGGTISGTGNVTGGNVLTGGIVSATSNITGGNLVTGGQVSSTGNVIGGNVLTSGFVSATGNITGANVNTAQVYGSSGLTLSTGSGDVNITPTSGNVVVDTYINGVLSPVQSSDAATKQYVDDAVSSGITIHTPVLVESPTALNATYTQGGTTATVTDTVAGNTVVFSSAINPQPNDQYWFTNSFNGIVGNVPYFVVSAPNTSAAVLSSTYNGVPVTNITNATGLTQAVRVNSGQGATLTNAGANATLVVDGVTLSNTNRVLVYTQANAVHNGVYVVTEAGNATTAWQLTRSSDQNTYIPNSITGMDAGDYFFVQSGDTGAGESYVLTSPTGTIIIGYNNITYTQFSASQVYSANTQAGLSLTGTVFSAKVDNNTTAFDGAGNIIVKAGANLTTPNIGAATGTSLSTTGTITGGNLATGGTVSATGTATVGNVATSGTVSATGNVTGGNVNTAGQVSSTGNVTGGNVLTSGLISATGTITSATTITGGNLATGGTVSATGNVTGGNVLTSGLISATSTITGGNLATGGTVSATGTATVGNLATSGTVSATGTATVGNLSTGGTVSATGNVTGGNVNTAGQVSATANVVGANLVTGGIVTSTGNITGGNILTGGLVSSTGTVTGGNLETSGTVSATGTATVGNLATSGTVSATGTATVGNVATSGTVSATGNITGGNIATAGQVSAAGNIYAANFFGNITGNVDAAGSNTWVQFNDTGDILGASAGFTFNKTSNTVTVAGAINSGNTISATGNITSGNIYTSGRISALGNIDGANVNSADRMIAQGNIYGGNLATGGDAQITGNITGGNIFAFNELEGGNIIISGDTIFGINGIVNINQGLQDVDFAVSGDITANILYIDAGTGTASFGSSAQTVNAIVAFNATNSVLMPTGNIGQRPATGVTGMLRFNTTNNALEIYDNSAWTTVGTPSFTVIADEQFYGDGSTVTYTLGSTQTTTSCIVAINGVVQIPVSAYSVSGIDPTCVLTFTEAPEPGDLIDVRELTTTTSVASISNQSGNAEVSTSDTSPTVNITGDLIPTGNLTANLGNATRYWNSLFVGGNTIYLGNLQLKAVTGETFAVYKSDGTTQANIDIGNVDVSSITSGTSIIGISGDGNIYNTVNGTANVLKVTTTGVAVTGTTSASGNITGGNILTGGLISSTGAITGANITGANILTGGSISATGTATVGNVSTVGLITATGNVTGGNVSTAGLITATGNVTGGNILTSGIMSSTGNATHGNVLTGGLVSATGTITAVANITGGNVLTGGLVSATGNVTGGNVLTGGVVSATGTITGGNLATGGTASATGNVTGGNVNTAGQVSATGNITGGNLVVTNNIYDASAMNIVTGAGNISISPAGNVVVNSKNINGVADPVLAQDVATKAYVDNIATTGISFHQAVTAATNTTLATATGGTIAYTQPNGVANGIGATITTTGSFNLIDTANVQTIGTRILVKNEANAVLNGVYTWANSTAIVRATDADEYGSDSATAFGINDYFFVTSGNVNAGSAFVVNAPSGTITFGTSNITFATFSTSQTYSANTSAGISLNGTVINAKTDGITTAFDGGGNIIVKASAALTTPNIGAATGTSLSVTGTVTAASTVGGVITGSSVSVTGAVNGAGITGTSLTVGTGTITGGNIVNSNANGVGNIGSSTTYFNTVFAKATSAQYADLAEKYTADAEYAPGTVVVFGGTHEVTVNAVDGDRKVAGVVSTNPSYIMNGGLEAEHVATIALTGRVPTFVIGPVRKGDLMVAAGLGRARAETNPQVGSVIGKALEDFDGAEGTIEVVVGRF